MDTFCSKSYIFQANSRAENNAEKWYAACAQILPSNVYEMSITVYYDNNY